VACGLSGCATGTARSLDTITDEIISLPGESGRFETAPCDFWTGCQTSITTDHVSVFSFETEDAAAATARAVGTDGHRVGTYLIRFNDLALSDEQRQKYIETVAPPN
jgi:hypothetical protein